MAVVLVGYRGSGKSTVGRILADRLGWELLDTDELIVRAAGKTIRAIFEQDGEVRFRDLEVHALALALEKTNVVVATGGGIVMREENRQRIRSSAQVVVYLAGSPEKLLQRIRGDVATAANRPNLTALGGGIEEVQHLLAVRDPLYREVATLVVETDAKEPSGVADEVRRVVSA